MNEIWQGVVTIAVAIIGVATLSVIVSRNSNTQGVVQAGGNAFAQAIGAAVAPVTGSGNFNVPLGFGQGVLQ